MSGSSGGRNSSGRGRGGRSGGRGGGARSNDSNNSSEKNNRKPNGKGVYKDGHFVGLHRNVVVVTAASTTKSKDLEDLTTATESWCKASPHTQKVGIAIQKKKDKTDWIPSWPDQNQWGHEKQVPKRDDNGDIVKNADNTPVMETVFVMDKPGIKEQKMSEYKRKSDLGEKNKDVYEDGVQAALTFMQGQIEKPIWKQIKNSSHPTSGKSFKEHAADNEINKCI